MNKYGYNEVASDGPSKEPEVFFQMQRLAANIESTYSRVELLADRLTPILGPAYPQPVSGETRLAAPPDCSPLASNLRGLTERVERIEAIVNQTIGRLEIG